MARRRGQRGYVHQQGNSWYVAYREDALDSGGKLVRIRRNIKIANAKEVTKREARRLANEMLYQVDQQALQPLSLVTVREFVKGKFEQDVVWSLKEAGKRHYRYLLDRHVLLALGDEKLRDITNDHVQALVRMKIEEGYSVQTAVHIRNAISAVFNHAKRKKAYHGENPAQGIRLPEMTRRESYSLTFEQGCQLLKLLPTPVREMVLLSMTTSLNVAEMLGLQVKWLNLLDEPMIVSGEILPRYMLGVRRNYYRGVFGSVKAKSRRRNVPLGSLVVESLDTLLDRTSCTGPDDLVFCTSEGKPLDDRALLRRVIKPVARELGMPWLGWHDLRHTHATLGEQIGMSLSDRQAQMGHGDVRMTLHYTHSDLERRREAIEVMSTLR